MTADTDATGADTSEEQLLARVKERLPELRQLLAAQSDFWGYEDRVYRFYHQSWKVYSLQGRTEEIVAALQGLRPAEPLNPWFTQIVADGTGNQFEFAHNDDWPVHTRPILEAYFHAHYMLQMIVRYGEILEAPPGELPSGWAAVLCLYGLR